MSVSLQEENKQVMSNLLHTVRYDKRTTHMNTDEQTYWMHFLQGDPMIGDYIRSQIRQNPKLRREILNQPVCLRCEKFCFYDKGGVQCPSCGTWTPESKTHTVKKHLREGYFR